MLQGLIFRKAQTCPFPQSSIKRYTGGFPVSGYQDYSELPLSLVSGVHLCVGCQDINQITYNTNAHTNTISWYAAPASILHLVAYSVQHA